MRRLPVARFVRLARGFGGIAFSCTAAALATQDHGQKIMVVPVIFTGHPRAKRLEIAMTKHELLVEFRWSRDASCVLRDCAWLMYATLRGEGLWPDKPALPNRGSASALIVVDVIA
jgi:hypothetical protein